MQLVKKVSLTIIVEYPQQLVNDQLLKEVHGEVLLIRSAHATTICKRSAKNMRQQVLSWLHTAGTDTTARFIAGTVSAKGGWFQIFNRDQAVELIATWIFKELQCGWGEHDIKQIQNLIKERNEYPLLLKQYLVALGE